MIAALVSSFLALPSTGPGAARGPQDERGDAALIGEGLAQPPADATPVEVERLALELYGARTAPEARLALLDELFESCLREERWNPARAYVASLIFYLGTDLEPARFEELAREITARPWGHEGGESFWWLMDRVAADLGRGSWTLADLGLRHAAGLLGPPEGLEREYRRVFLEGNRATLLMLMARFQQAAAASEATRQAQRAFEAGAEAMSADERAGFPWTVDYPTDLASAWREAALVELALALAQTQLARVLAIHERLAAEPMHARLAPAHRAELALRVAMAEVEGRRRGELPTADPVARVAALLPDLEGHARDGFRALWWLGRALVDEGRLDEARALLPRLAAHLAAHPEWERLELLAVALEARLAREGRPEEIAAVLPRLDAAFERFLDEWSRAPLDESGTGYLSFEEWNMVASELVTLHDLAAPGEEGARAGLERTLRAQARGTLGRRLGAREIDLARVRAELLGPGEGALVYGFGRERLHLFVLDAERVEHVPLAADFELDRDREAFLAAIEAAVAGGSADAVAEAARAFAERVLPPPALAALRAWEGVVVVGLDAIGFAPFELLPLDGEELGVARAVRYLPSFPLGAALAERARASPRTVLEVLGVAAPECGVAEDEREAYLFDRAQAERLWEPYRNPRSLLGASEATRARLDAAHPGDFRVAHWIVHGERDPYRPRPGGLRLYGDDGDDVLWAEDLERRRAGPLVVLTACEAGRARLRRGDDGVGNLGSAFFLGGASTVLLSHVRIGLAPSLAILTPFHAELRAGRAPADALRRARRAAETPLERLNAALVHVVGLDSPVFDRRDPPPRSGAPLPWTVLAWALPAGVALLLAVAWAALRRGGDVRR